MTSPTKPWLDPVLQLSYTYHNSEWWRFDELTQQWVNRAGDVARYQSNMHQPPVTGYAMAQSSHYYGRDRSYTMDSGISNNTSGLEDQMGHLNITTNYGSHRGGNTTTGATGNSSTRQQQYRMRNKRENFFKVGRVFKTCWNEEWGHTAVPDAACISVNSCGKYVCSKNRIFVVIKDNKNDSSQCLLVVTHQGKGVSNPRMVKEHHAIIYDGDEEPNPDPSELPRPGEPGMRRSIRVKLRSRRDGLHPRSRINFNMSFPIQHNVEVYDMCIVDEAHLDVLRAEYFAVNFPGDDTYMEDCGGPSKTKKKKEFT